MLERDDEIEAFFLADGLDAEHLRDVDDADAAHFHVVARQFGAGAEHVAAVHQHGLHHIVGHEAVTAFDQRQHGLAFADAAFARMITPTPRMSTMQPSSVARGANIISSASVALLMNFIVTSGV
jgi:hypothetical protein